MRTLAIGVATVALTCAATAMAGAGPASVTMHARPMCRGIAGPLVWYVPARHTYYPRSSASFGKGAGQYRCRADALRALRAGGSLNAASGTMHGRSNASNGTAGVTNGNGGAMNGSTGAMNGGALNHSMPAGGTVNTGGATTPNGAPNTGTFAAPGPMGSPGPIASHPPR